MKTVIPQVAAFVVAFAHPDLWAMGSPAPDVTCSVQAGTLLNTVPPGLFGANAEWFNQGDGLVDANGNLNLNLLATAANQGASSIRFPGGTLSDFYHWQNGVGPMGSRPIVPHGIDPGSERDVYGTPEFLKSCQLVAATPLITVNVGTGTAGEAAGWVDYCNNPNNAQRAADGVAPTTRVPFWELGNELYFNSSAVEQQITQTPAQYAQNVLSFATAMRQIDPTIQLLAIGAPDRAGYPLASYQNWTQTVLQTCASQIDYIAYHDAYFPGFSSLNDPTLQAGYQAMWAAPETVDQELSQLEGWITRYQQSRPINIAVTEWGPLFGMLPDWIDHNKTMGSAVYVDRMMQVFLSHPKVKIANYFKLTDDTHMGWNSYLNEPKVPYYVIQLFTQHFGTATVAASVTSPTYSTPALGFVPPETNVNLVTAVASIDPATEKLYINFVNRDWAQTHYVQLTIGGFAYSTTTGTLWQIYSSSVTDNNGPDIMPGVGITYVDPSIVASNVQIQSGAASLNAPIALPPHSVETLEIDGTMPAPTIASPPQPTAASAAQPPSGGGATQPAAAGGAAQPAAEGGGGAPSDWFLGLLALAAGLRRKLSPRAIRADL
jgi:alpha-N-arabinofuranosidase